jgi:hypothetical protein
MLKDFHVQHSFTLWIGGLMMISCVVVHQIHDLTSHLSAVNVKQNLTILRIIVRLVSWLFT